MPNRLAHATSPYLQQHAANPVDWYPWGAEALAAARRREPVGNVGKKLDAVRAATRHSYPTADINDMLAEIERGYGASERR